MNEVRQSYAEQQNPPTDESTSANETRTAWACISTEVGYGDAYSTAVSVQEKLNDIDTTVAGKANATHNQSASTITGLATVATSGSYNDLEDQPTIPTIPSSLPANGGNADTVDNKHASEFALSVHTHSTSDVSGLTDALSGKADINHTHDYAASTHTHTLDSVSETTSKKIMTADERTKLSGIETGANNYSHPSSHPSSMISGLATVATSGKYSDLSEKPTSMTPTSHTHAQSDVTGLTTALNEKANQTHTHLQSDVTGLSDALDAKANVNHTHQIYSSIQSVSSYKMIYLATNGNDNNNGFSQSTPMATIKGALKKYADTYKFIDIRLADGTYTENVGTVAIDQCNLSIRSISSDKDAVTLNMDTSIEFSVNEARMYNMTINVTVTGIRPICVNAGVFYAYGVRFNVPTNSNSSCINVYNGTSAFMMDCIFNSGTGSATGACVYGNQAMMIKAINCTSERTVATAFHAINGTEIVYSDTITATTKTKEMSYGKCTVRASEPSVVLWSGSLFMNASHTVTPTKKLSDCQNGWVLLWSDYDEDSSVAQDADFVTTVIYKKKPNGESWDGKTFHCEVPRFYGSNTSDVDTERRIMKTLYIYNDKIVGHAINDKDERTDVVLRAVYEF